MSAAPAQKPSVDIARLGKRLYRQVGQALSDFNMIEGGDLERWAAHRAFPLIPCTLCGNQENLQRVKIRRMLCDWEREHPGSIDNLFKAMGNVIPSHLADRNLYPFARSKQPAWPMPAATAPSMPTTSARRRVRWRTCRCAGPPESRVSP